MLAIAEVRVKRGSAWMSVQGFGQRVLAFITQRKATGWHSAMFEPMMRMLSECCRSGGKGGGAAAAVRSAQTGHGRAVSYPGLVFEVDHPQGPHQLALDVVPFVVHRRPAERGDAPACG